MMIQENQKLLSPLHQLVLLDFVPQYDLNIVHELYKIQFCSSLLSIGITESVEEFLDSCQVFLPSVVVDDDIVDISVTVF